MKLHIHEKLVLAKWALNVMKRSVVSMDDGWIANRRANIIALKAEIRRLEKKMGVTNGTVR